MKFSHRFEDQICILAIDGNVTLDSIEEVEKFLNPHFEGGEIKAIVINLAKVKFIDSSGIGLIVSIFKTMRDRNGGFAITNLSERNVEIFTITRLDNMLEIFPSETEALSSLKN